MILWVRMYCFVNYSIKCHDFKLHTVKVRFKVQCYVKLCALFKLFKCVWCWLLLPMSVLKQDWYVPYGIYIPRM